MTTSSRVETTSAFLPRTGAPALSILRSGRVRPGAARTDALRAPARRLADPQLPARTALLQHLEYLLRHASASPRNCDLPNVDASDVHALDAGLVGNRPDDVARLDAVADPTSIRKVSSRCRGLGRTRRGGSSAGCAARGRAFRAGRVRATRAAHARPSCIRRQFTRGRGSRRARGRSVDAVCTAEGRSAWAPSSSGAEPAPAREGGRISMRAARFPPPAIPHGAQCLAWTAARLHDLLPELGNAQRIHRIDLGRFIGSIA